MFRFSSTSVVVIAALTMQLAARSASAQVGPADEAPPAAAETPEPAPLPPAQEAPAAAPEAPPPAPLAPATPPPPPAPASTTPPVAPEEEEDDSRDADILWIEIEGGYSFVDLAAFQNQGVSTVGGTETDAFPYEYTSGDGPVGGAALGFRLFFFELGARFTYAGYGDFSLGTVGGEVQLRLPIFPVIEPWARIGAGYAWQGDATYVPSGGRIAVHTDVYGWNLNAGVGVDFFVAWWLSLGIGASLDYLNLTRQNPTADECDFDEFCPTEPGDAIGGRARLTAQVGLHF